MSNVGQQMSSGALSGLATTVCLQPFDLLKTRMQQGNGSVNRNGPHPSVIMSTARQIIHSSGWRGLWRGTSATLIRNVPGVALYMTSLTQLRSFMATSPSFALMRKSRHGVSSPNNSVLPSLTSQGNLLAGAATRVGVGFLLNPFSVLKARFESNIYAYESVTGGLISIIRQGPSELLRGFMASSMRDAPYAGLFVVFYESIKRESSFLLPPQSSLQGTIVHGFSAASAGAIATLATHPFDVIKTKIQVRPENQYHSFMGTVRTVWMQRGVSGFFDGASLRMSRKVLSSAIGWAVYEGVLILWTS